MYEGIVLAGGFSSRFNTNKMCAVFKGKALILHTIKTMLEVCEEVFVVTGYYHDEISTLLSDMNKVKIIYNENYDLGMFSSVKAGVCHVNHNFFIIPGDYPLVDVTTYYNLIKGSKRIRVPSFDKHLGHPIYFDYSMSKEILNTDKNNLKDFRNQYDFEIIDVNDRYILLDIDKVDDFKKIDIGRIDY